MFWKLSINISCWINHCIHSTFILNKSCAILFEYIAMCFTAITYGQYHAISCNTIQFLQYQAIWQSNTFFIFLSAHDIFFISDVHTAFHKTLKAHIFIDIGHRKVCHVIPITQMLWSMKSRLHEHCMLADKSAQCIMSWKFILG